MNRASDDGEAKQKTTGRVLVIRVVFDYFRFNAGLAYFVLSYVAFNSAPKSMMTELKLTFGYLITQLL